MEDVKVLVAEGLEVLKSIMADYQNALEEVNQNVALLESRIKQLEGSAKTE